MQEIGRQLGYLVLWFTGWHVLEFILSFVAR